MREGQQSHGGAGKRKDMEFLGKPPLPKKGRSVILLIQEKIGDINYFSTEYQWEVKKWSDPLQDCCYGEGGSNDQKDIVYPFCAQYEQKHPSTCLVSLGRCFICRGEGYRCRACQYLGRGRHHYGEKGHFKRECPQLNTEQH